MRERIYTNSDPFIIGISVSANVSLRDVLVAENVHLYGKYKSPVLSKHPKFKSLPIAHLAHPSEPKLDRTCHTIYRPVEPAKLLKAVDDC